MEIHNLICLKIKRIFCPGVIEYKFLGSAAKSSETPAGKKTSAENCLSAVVGNTILASESKESDLKKLINMEDVHKASLNIKIVHNQIYLNFFLYNSSLS